MDKTETLADCPFCGGAMMFRKALWPSDGCTDAVIHAEPTDCGMAAFDTGKTDESVITTWNTRTPRPDNALADDAVERVAKAITEEIGWGTFDHFNPDDMRRISRAALSTLTPSPAVDLLREAREILSDAAEVPLADPYILVELRALCERAGYGNVMKSASALWRERLGELAGGEFVCSPCRSTVANLLARIDAALKEAKDG